MTKDKTLAIIIQTLEEFKIKAEYLSDKKTDKEVTFNFKIKSKLKAERLFNYCEDLRASLNSPVNVKMEIVNVDTIGIILPIEYATETEEIEENQVFTGDERIDKAINEIRSDLKHGKTADMETLLKALEIEYDKLDKKHEPLEEDEEYVKVLGYAVEQGRITITGIQRKFKFGYVKAGKLVDDFESKGYVTGSPDNRDYIVLMNKEEFKAKYNK